jgi:large subunit ribosomal protein L18
VNTLLRKENKNEARQKRHGRMRRKVVGTAERPRLNVFRSLSNIYAQIIDDQTGNTLVSASTQDKELRTNGNYGGNIEVAKTVGELIAKRALAKGITKVVFDRGGYIYHGRVAALAEAAREAGLEF